MHEKREKMSSLKLSQWDGHVRKRLPLKRQISDIFDGAKRIRGKKNINCCNALISHF